MGRTGKRGRKVKTMEDNSPLSREQRTFLTKLKLVAGSYLPNRIILAESQGEDFVYALRYLLLTKYLRTFQAFLLIVDNNFGEDAAILLRSLFEIWVKILHIAKYPKESSLLYLIQMGRQRVGTVVEWRKDRKGRLPDDYDYMKEEMGDREFIRALIDKLKEISHSIGDEKEVDLWTNELSTAVWPNKSLFDLLHEANPNVETLYGSVYRYASAMIHSNAGILYLYHDSTNGDIIPKIESNGKFILEMSYGSAGMLLDILNSVNEVYKMNRSEEINELTEEFHKFFTSALTLKL